MPSLAPRCFGSAAMVISVSGRLEQDVVDDGLVRVGDGGDRGREREHDMEVRHRQGVVLALWEPLLRGCALALRAMPVATGVIGDRRVRAVLAACDVAAERRRAATLDRRHDLELAEAHMAGVGRAPGGPVVAEDVRDLQSGTGHERWRAMRAARLASAGAA